MDLLADFDTTRQLLESDLPRYSAWARDNCGAKSGGSVSNPTVTSELGKWVRFRDQIIRGVRPVAPAMTTKMGKALVATGGLYLAGAANLKVSVSGNAVRDQKLAASIGDA